MRPVPVLVLVFVLVWLCSCTWGTYVPGDGGPMGTMGVVVSSGPGGNVVSDDGLFEVRFPAGSLNIDSRVSIVKSQGQGAGYFGTQYEVDLFAATTSMQGPSPQIMHPVELVFHLQKSGFNIPMNECFIQEIRPSSRILAGAYVNSDVYAIQPAEGSSPSLGPYAPIHIIGSKPPTNACSNMSNVCGQCALGCGGMFETNNGNFGRACQGIGFSESGVACLLGCITMGEAEICQ